MSRSGKDNFNQEGSVKQTSSPHSVPAPVTAPASGDEACVEFQKGLSDLLSSENPDLASHPHIQTCEKCAALVRDLEAIAQAARQLLPTYEPSPNLWTQIQSAMKDDTGEDPDDHVGAVAKDGPNDATGPTPSPAAKPVSKNRPN